MSAHQFDLDAHMDEHLAEKAAKEAAEAAAAEAKREAERIARNEEERIARIARNKQRATHLEQIAKIVRGYGKDTTATVNVETCDLIINGVSTRFIIDFTEEMRNSQRWSFRNRYTGRTRIVIGNFGERVSYPPRKDGTYNYANMAEQLYNFAQHQSNRAKMDKAREDNKAAAARVRKQFGFHEYDSNVKPSADPTRPVFVSVKIEGSFTEGEAVALFNKLRLAGVLK